MPSRQEQHLEPPSVLAGVWQRKGHKNRRAPALPRRVSTAAAEQGGASKSPAAQAREVLQGTGTALHAARQSVLGEWNVRDALLCANREAAQLRTFSCRATRPPRAAAALLPPAPPVLAAELLTLRVTCRGVCWGGGTGYDVNSLPCLAAPAATAPHATSSQRRCPCSAPSHQHRHLHCPAAPARAHWPCAAPAPPTPHRTLTVDTPSTNLVR